MRKNIKKIILTSFSLSFILANISSFASPSFTRSSEEWARLKDNKLEYDEIEGLIEEYNPSVKENEIAIQSLGIIIEDLQMKYFPA